MPDYARSNLTRTLFKQTGGGKTNLGNLFTLIVSKKEFFLMTLATFIVQLGITYYVMEKTNYSKVTNKKTNILYIVQLLLIVILALVPMPMWLKFILFSLFSATWGYQLSTLRPIVGEDNIKMAMMGAASIFAVMFAFGVGLILSGIRLGYKFGLMLFYALLILLLFRIMQIFIPTSSLTKKILVIFSLLLFSVYVVYDTNSILQRNYNGDFITASLDYYLDILNIFSNLLSFGRD
jgi:FtsH-binding integral membrane protein